MRCHDPRTDDRPFAQPGWYSAPRSQLRVDAVIAGHTHGGQIVVPGYGAVMTMARVCGRRSASGWVGNSRTALYVTRGLGEQLPLPLRFKCRREVLVLRLTSGSQQPA